MVDKECWSRIGTLLAGPVQWTDGMRKNRSVVIATILAALPGLVGLFGMGHLYLRRFRRGCVFLLTGWGLAFLSFIFLAMYFASGFVVPPPGYPPVEPPAEADLFLIAGFLMGLGFVVVLVAQTLDARTICRQQNAALDGELLSTSND